MNINKPQHFLMPSLCNAFENIIDSLHKKVNKYDKDCILYCDPNGLCYFSYQKNINHILYFDYLLFEPLEGVFKITKEEKNILISKYITNKFGLKVEWITNIN